MADKRASIDRALARGDVQAAARLAVEAVADGSTEPILLNLAAWDREEAFDFAGARVLLDRAEMLAPDDATIITAQGRVDRLQGHINEALRRFEAATALDPAFAVPWLERGLAFDFAGETAAARQSYLRATALDPGLAVAWAGAASMAAREGDSASASGLATRALDLDPANAVAHCALAASEIETGAHAAAVNRLNLVLGSKGQRPEDRIAALTLLGDAYDHAGAADDAFAAWASAKTEFAAFHARRFGHLEPQRAFIDRLAARLASADPERWQARIAPSGHGPADAHIFLLGYPRSGTTLVENILAGAPGVVALEERPTLVDADSYLVEDDGLDRLLAADKSEIVALREAYWRRVAANGGDPTGKIVVDMNPMNGMKLPLIARLFPDARIVVMRRDPRDIVLSCFRQNFRVGAVALSFTTLAGTAEHYATTTALTEQCLALLPLDYHIVPYDVLVAEFDSTTRALCAFTGVDWSPRLRRFDRVARLRGVTTASANQVRRGLYDGRGKWRRYANQLAPVLPILDPWVERFGFSD